MGTSAGTEESVSALSRPPGMLLRWDGPREHHIYAVDSGRAKATGVPSGGTKEMNTATQKVLPPRAHQVFG